MEKLTILTADLLDIVFEHRNKMYGAYDLRRTYSKRIMYAVGGMMFICFLFVGGSILANNKNNSSVPEIVTDVVLTNFEEPPVEPPPPPPPPKVTPPPQIKMEIFTPPKIVQEEIKPEEQILEVDKLEEVKIGPIRKDGEINVDIVTPPVEKTGAAVEAPKVTIDVDERVTFVHIEARFNGGPDAWKKYLERNLNASLPADNGAPPKNYTVTVSFVVDRAGNISEVRSENDPGFGTAAEAIRVIKKSPNWIPAVQNGRNVVYRQKQQITFQVREE